MISYLPFLWNFFFSDRFCNKFYQSMFDLISLIPIDMIINRRWPSLMSRLIRAQYSGHMTSIDQSQASIRVTWPYLMTGWDDNRSFVLVPVAEGCRGRGRGRRTHRAVALLRPDTHPAHYHHQGILTRLSDYQNSLVVKVGKMKVWWIPSLWSRCGIGTRLRKNDKVIVKP